MNENTNPLKFATFSRMAIRALASKGISIGDYAKMSAEERAAIPLPAKLRTQIELVLKSKMPKTDKGLTDTIAALGKPVVKETVEKVEKYDPIVEREEAVKEIIEAVVEEKVEEPKEEAPKPVAKKAPAKKPAAKKSAPKGE